MISFISHSILWIYNLECKLSMSRWFHKIFQICIDTINIMKCLYCVTNNTYTLLTLSCSAIKSQRSLHHILHTQAHKTHIDQYREKNILKMHWFVYAYFLSSITIDTRLIIRNGNALQNNYFCKSICVSCFANEMKNGDSFKWLKLELT